MVCTGEMMNVSVLSLVEDMMVIRLLFPQWCSSNESI